MIVEDASQTDYDKFLHEDYDPALASMKASCAELINADGLAANDAKVRNFAKFKLDAVEARERAARSRR